MIVISIVAAALLIGIDQLIKYWAINSLSSVGTIELIPNLFSLTYVENYGAAFGILQQKQLFLIIITSIIILIILFLITTKKIQGLWPLISATLILTGGAGNLVDRIVRGFVVDYLDFSSLWNFPVFNFADCCVVVGTFLFLVYTIFTDKDFKKIVKS